MIRVLKAGQTVAQKAQNENSVRDTVTGILADIEARGDAAVAELSKKFDSWSPASFRLSDDEIAKCVTSLSQGEVDDIKIGRAHV